MRILLALFYISSPTKRYFSRTSRASFPDRGPARTMPVPLIAATGPTPPNCCLKVYVLVHLSATYISSIVKYTTFLMRKSEFISRNKKYYTCIPIMALF